MDSGAGTITPGGVFRAGFTKGIFNDALVVTARDTAGSGPGLVQATASVTVVDLRGELQPASVRVLPETAEVEPGETRRLIALAVDANGVAIPNLKFKWEMLEPLAGSISQDGRLTASANIGTFPSAIQVTLVPEKEDIGEKISTSLDVLIIDSAGLAQQISATVLPKVISLRPKEEIRFTSMVLDRRGNQIPTLEPRWEILDARAGVISNDGRFKAGEEPGIYSDAIHVSMGVTGVDEKVVATGTVIIVDVTVDRQR